MLARRSFVQGSLATAAVASTSLAPGAAAVAAPVAAPGGRRRGRLAWGPVSAQTRPWTRWWWLGSAVDGEGLTRHLTQFRAVGIGGVEVQPIYEAQGYEDRVRDYLSPAWQEAVDHTARQARRMGLGVDLNNGSGWNLGGPWVTPEQSAARALVGRWTLEGGQRLGEPVRAEQRDHPGPVDEEKLSVPALAPPRQPLPEPPLSALVAREAASGQTLDLTGYVRADGTLDWTAPAGSWALTGVFSGLVLKRVERAGPGGKGLMADFLGGSGVRTHLARLTAALGPGKRGIRASFHDSFELEATDWSRTFLADFRQVKGYDLVPHLPDLFAAGPASETQLRVLADVRSAMSELFVSRFVRTWRDWAHDRDQLARNQGHGSPANLLDVNGAVDIPETEYLGAGIFPIPGLRRGAGDAAPPPYLVWRMASSPAHLTGGGLASAESITWLDEHYHAALSQTKPAIDALFSAGINHIFFHGSTYSPADAPWPGFSFYAAAEVNPTSSLWHDLPELTGYITRTQSVLQSGRQDNDLLVYWPQHELWRREDAGLGNDDRELSPDYKWQGTPWMYEDPTGPGSVVDRLDRDGYQLDWVSDAQLDGFRSRAGVVRNRHARYQAVLVPRARVMPVATLSRLRDLAEAGATVVFAGGLPRDVPGLHRLEQQQRQLRRLRREMTRTSVAGRPGVHRVGRGEVVVVEPGRPLHQALARAGVVREPAADRGLRVLRRRHAQGYHYFLANVGAKTVSRDVRLGRAARSVAVLDALRDESGVAAYRRRVDGRGDVAVRLQPGESILLRTFDRQDLRGQVMAPWRPDGTNRVLRGPWELSFIEGAPTLPPTRTLDRLGPWQGLGPAEEAFSGTARYSTTFDLSRADARADWLLELGEVRDTARVRVNGQPVGTAWSVPFELPLRAQLLRSGENTLEVEVTNASANRVRALARAGELDVPHFIAWRSGRPPAEWEPVESGLTGRVRLRRVG